MRSLRLSFLPVLGLMLSPPAFSQKSQVAANDTSLVLRTFDAGTLKKYRIDRDFDYGEAQPDISPSWWDQFWDWFWSLFKETVTGSGTGILFQYLLIALGIAAIIFLII